MLQEFVAVISVLASGAEKYYIGVVTQPAAPKKFKLHLLEDKFAISKLPLFEEVPKIFAKGEMVFIMRTDDELCIISPEFMAPTNVQQDIGYRCFRVDGQISLQEVGVVATLTKALADANISVFVISTFNTDYIFFREENLLKAVKALQQAGHEFIHKEG